VPIDNVLRYDDVPLEDFMACLYQYDQRMDAGYLPPPGHLSEVKLTGRWSPGSGDSEAPLSIYLLQEVDAISEMTETFLILASEGDVAPDLRALGLQMKTYLASRGEPSMIRIDPRYGPVCGSGLEPVDPAIRWDRPRLYLAIYLTSDPGSPSLAVMEYVPQNLQGRFKSLFEKYNGISPKKPSLLSKAWDRLKLSAPAPAELEDKVDYTLVRKLVPFLARQKVHTVRISLIFKEMGARDTASILLDKRYSASSATGHDRFLASLGELM
jgi:hypothetical protein